MTVLACTYGSSGIAHPSREGYTPRSCRKLANSSCVSLFTILDRVPRHQCWQHKTAARISHVRYVLELTSLVLCLLVHACRGLELRLAVGKKEAWGACSATG